MTQDEALDMLIKSRVELSEKLCPIFKTKCKEGECVSYFDGCVLTEFNEYKCYNAACSCSLVMRNNILCVKFLDGNSAQIASPEKWIVLNAFGSVIYKSEQVYKENIKGGSNE